MRGFLFPSPLLSGTTYTPILGPRVTPPGADHTSYDVIVGVSFACGRFGKSRQNAPSRVIVDTASIWILDSARSHTVIGQLHYLQLPRSKHQSLSEMLQVFRLHTELLSAALPFSCVPA